MWRKVRRIYRRFRNWLNPFNPFPLEDRKREFPRPHRPGDNGRQG